MGKCLTRSSPIGGGIGEVRTFLGLHSMHKLKDASNQELRQAFCKADHFVNTGIKTGLSSKINSIYTIIDTWENLTEEEKTKLAERFRAVFPVPFTILMECVQATYNMYIRELCQGELENRTPTC